MNKFPPESGAPPNVQNFNLLASQRLHFFCRATAAQAVSRDRRALARETPHEHRRPIVVIYSLSLSLFAHSAKYNQTYEFNIFSGPYGLQRLKLILFNVMRHAHPSLFDAFTFATRSNQARERRKTAEVNSHEWAEWMRKSMINIIIMRVSAMCDDCRKEVQASVNMHHRRPK